MRRFALAVLACAALAAPTAADEAEKHGLAQRAVKAGYEFDIADRIMGVFWPVALAVIKARVPGVTEVQLFQYRGKTEAFATDAAHQGLAPLVELYERSFTEDELRVIAEFYEGPAGRKLKGTEAAIAAMLSGAAGDSLNDAVVGMTRRVDDLLATDGY